MEKFKNLKYKLGILIIHRNYQFVCNIRICNTYVAYGLSIHVVIWISLRNEEKCKMGRKVFTVTMMETVKQGAETTNKKDQRRDEGGRS